MLLVVLAIAASTAVGVVADRRYGDAAQRAAQRVIALMLWGLLPFIGFFVIARLEVTSGVGVGLLLAYTELLICGVLAWLVATRLLRLAGPAAGAVVVTVMLANTGYLGIPLCAALLGTDAIAPAIAWDAAVSAVMLYTAGFAVGAALGSAAGTTPRERARAFVSRNPVLAAVLLGLVAPDALAPDTLVDAAEALSFALAPLGFFILGVNLTEEGVRRLLPPLTGPIATVLGLRLLVAPGLMLVLSALIVDVPDAYLVQAAMPSGINSLIVAHVYGLDLRLVAGAIAWTTTAVVAVATVAGLAV